MKKDIPNIIRIEIPHDVAAFEKLHIYTIHQDFESGYSISHYDFDVYCAMQIRLLGLDKLPDSYKSYCIEDDNTLKTRIRFHKIRIEKQISGNISPDDEIFFNSYRRKKVDERKEIIRKEISRTGINANKINFHTSDYLRNLLQIVREFDDEITLVRWFIPIKLSFEKLVHIYIKHVEETKFSQGAFAKRTFFDYKYEQIFRLLRMVISVEEENIKQHFGNVAVAKILGDKIGEKDYINNRIEYNSDSFALAITSNGYISKFHQVL